MLASTALFFSSLHALTPVLPLYVAHLGGDPSSIGWLVGAFSVSALLARPYATQLSENVGRRTAFLAGAAVFALAPALYILAASLPLLFALRLFHGVGIALFVVGAWALVADLIPPARRGEGMGYFSLSLLIGMALMPPLVVALLPRIGFAGTFLVASLCAVASLACGYPVAQARRARNVTKAPGMLATARHRWLLVLTIALITGALTLGAIQSFLPLFAVQRGVENVGVFFSVYAIATLGARAIVGPLSDRVGRMEVLIPAQVLVAATMFVLARAGSTFDLVVVAVLYAFSFGTILPVVTTIVVDRAPDEARGAALSVSTASFDLGIGAGALTLGAVSAALGYPAMFEITGIVSLAGAALLVWDHRTQAKARQAPR